MKYILLKNIFFPSSGKEPEMIIPKMVLFFSNSLTSFFFFYESQNKTFYLVNFDLQIFFSDFIFKVKT